MTAEAIGWGVCHVSDSMDWGLHWIVNLEGWGAHMQDGPVISDVRFKVMKVWAEVNDDICAIEAASPWPLHFER